MATDELGPLGLNLPDARWEPYRPEHLAAARALRPAALVALAPAYGPVGLRRRQVEQVRRLVADLGCRLILRPDAEGIPRRDPTVWAAQCARRAAWFDTPGLRLELAPAHEPNHPGRGGHEDFDRHAAWLLAFAARYRELRPGDLLHLPAPWSGGPGEANVRALRYWQALAERGVHAAYDRVDSHEYGEALGLHAHAWRLLAKPVDVTEFNQIDPVRMADLVRADQHLGTACWFILSGSEDLRPCWLLGGPYEAAFASAQGTAGQGWRTGGEG